MAVAGVSFCPTAMSRRARMPSVPTAWRWSVTACCGCGCCDLESPLADMHFDVQQIPMGDGEVDTIICNHILEHVEDDSKALRELYRILRPNGWAVILSPVDLEREHTFEDDTITDPKERTRIFGQYDHRRIYGRDYVERLAAVGFEVYDIPYKEEFSQKEQELYALPDEHLYVVRKPLNDR